MKIGNWFCSDKFSAKPMSESFVFCLAACSTDKEYHIETSDGVILYVHVRGCGPGGKRYDS